MKYKENIKNVNRNNGKLLCKCGSIRYNVQLYKDDYDDYNWIEISCKKCGRVLLYNGA